MDSYDFDVCLTPAARELLRPGEALVLVLRNKAIPEDAGDVKRAVGGHLDRDPEHLVDLVTLLGA
jgi:hypothetical protein